MFTAVAPSISLPSPQSLQQLIKGVERLYTIRYVTLSVYIVLLSEHLASIPDEIELVWKAPWNLAKTCFLLYRYSTVAGLTVLMHVLAGLSGSLDENFCKHAVAAMAALSTLSMGIADAMVVLRVSVLWGRQRAILITLCLSFIATYATAIVCTVLASTKLVQSTIVVPIPGLNVCVPTARPTAVYGIWIPGMVFDVLVLALTGLNACARPRSEKTALTEAMYRDGVVFFLVLAALRSASLFVAIWSPFFIVGVCIAWPIAAVTLSRLVLHLRHIEQAHPMESSFDFGSFDIGAQHASTTNLPSGPAFQMRMWESVDAQSQFGGSTVVSSDGGVK